MKEIYVRLLSYDNAIKLIDFVNQDFLNYAHIVPGGVSLQVSLLRFQNVIDFLDSLGVNYEFTKTSPSKVNEEIVNALKESGVIE